MFGYKWWISAIFYFHLIPFSSDSKECLYNSDSGLESPPRQIKVALKQPHPL